MNVYRLYDAKLRVACNAPPVRMTAEAADLANRDLYLDGRKNIGWIPAERVESKQQAPAAEPSPELIAALTGLGFKPKEARKLAAGARGTTEDALKSILQRGQR
jgi:hypothetical protein